MPRESVLIIIPAYNEELTIGSVVALSKRYGDVLVVDDGSQDRTTKIASSCGAHVLRHEKNKGKSAALETGFRYALEKNYDIVVTLDADGQHDPDFIPSVIEPILRGDADMVIGSRTRGKNRIPLYRRFGLWILNKGTQIASNLNIDSQSGFRAMRKELLEGIDLECEGYCVETEMIVKALERGFKIVEVPIEARYDVPHKHKRHPLLHGLELLDNLLGLIGYRRPLLLFGSLSLISFACAVMLGYWALEPYYSGGHVYLTQAIGAGIFTVIGIQLLIAGFTLNVLAKMVR